jgi:hypothetical protein
VSPQVASEYEETGEESQKIAREQTDVAKLQAQQQAQQGQVEAQQYGLDLAHAQTQEARRTNVLSGHMREIDALRRDAADAKIDPQKAVDEMGLPKKVLLALSAAIGGFANGYSHGAVKNAGLDMINKIVDDHVAAQRANASNKHAAVEEARSSYRDSLDAFGDERVADALERNLVHQKLAAIADSEANKAQIPSLEVAGHATANELRKRDADKLRGAQQYIAPTTAGGVAGKPVTRQELADEVDRQMKLDPNLSVNEAMKRADAIRNLHTVDEAPRPGAPGSAANPLLRAPPTTSANIFRGGDLTNMIGTEGSRERDTKRQAYNGEILTQVLERSPSPRAASAVAASMQIPPEAGPREIKLRQTVARQWMAAHPPKKGVRTSGGSEEPEEP